MREKAFSLDEMQKEASEAERKKSRPKKCKCAPWKVHEVIKSAPWKGQKMERKTNLLIILSKNTQCIE